MKRIINLINKLLYLKNGNTVIFRMNGVKTTPIFRMYARNLSVRIFPTSSNTYDLKYIDDLKKNILIGLENSRYLSYFSWSPKGELGNSCPLRMDLFVNVIDKKSNKTIEKDRLTTIHISTPVVLSVDEGIMGVKFTAIKNKTHYKKFVHLDEHNPVSRVVLPKLKAKNVKMFIGIEFMAQPLL